MRFGKLAAGAMAVMGLVIVGVRGADTQPVATAEAGKSLKDSLLPAPKNGGFRMPGEILWCPSVIKVDDTYHMFCSHWVGTLGDWTSKSECIHATSKELLGPYTFMETVMKKRPDNWDKSRVHNIKIVKAPDPETHKDKFVIFYINSANQTGTAVADSINGPWTRGDKPVISASNPAPLVREDGSLYVFCRKGDANKVNRGIAFTAPSYKGPFTVVQNGENLLPNGGELEDPTIWFAHDQYNVVLNDWKGHATGTEKNGAQYYSKDGIHYTLMSSDSIFTKTIPYDDGTSETVKRRERPFVFANEKGEAIALFTACLVDDHEAKIVVQPIDHYVPGN